MRDLARYEPAVELLKALAAPVRLAALEQLSAGLRCVHELVAHVVLDLLRHVDHRHAPHEDHDDEHRGGLGGWPGSGRTGLSRYWKSFPVACRA